MDTAPAQTAPRSRLLEFTVLGTVLAAILYVVGFQSETRRAEALDRPLRQAWESFAATNQSSEATAGLTLDQLPAALETIRQSVADLAELRLVVAERIGLPADVVAQIQSPFLFIDFENERLRHAESLFALARSKKVAFAPDATNGLPQYTADTAEPSLLWARLEFSRQLLLAAIHAQVGAVRELVQLPAVSHRSLINGRRLYEELPMRVEVVGAVEPVGRFLASLPLRDAELEATGLAGVLTNKPALFLSHLLARKSAPERPAELRAELIVSGFVPLETGRGTASPRATAALLR